MRSSGVPLPSAATVLATLTTPILVPPPSLVLTWVEVNGKKECHWVEAPARMG